MKSVKKYQKALDKLIAMSSIKAFFSEELKTLQKLIDEYDKLEKELRNIRNV